MKIIADTHSHTVVSGHAYSTMKEMASAAAKNGLEVLALTEHAPQMPGTCGAFYFRNYQVVPRKQCGIQLLLGSEVNIMGLDGSVDLEEDTLQLQDIVIASIHMPCFGLDKTMAENTQAYLNAMKNPYINIIGHPDDGRFPVDMEALVLGAKATNTLLEINNSSLMPNGFRKNAYENASRMLHYCKQYDVSVTVGSDAHIDIDAGNFKNAIQLLETCNFPERLVANTSLKKLEPYINAYKCN
ncbi:MAG: phosphatase [Lachnospiraceae bacterium]